MMRINLSATLTVLLLFLILTSCGQSNKERVEVNLTPETWTLEEAAKPYEGTTITVIGEDYAPLQAVKEIKGEFEEITGINVRVEGYEAEVVQQKINLDINAGSGTYDLITQVYFDIGRLATRDQIRPIDDYMANPNLHNPDFTFDEQLFSGWRSMSTYQGEIYGFPLMVLTMYTWYREDLLNDPAEQQAFQKRYNYQLTPPQTWQQYRDIAEFFTRPKEDLYGTLVQGKKHIALWQEYLNYLYSFGGSILDTDDPSEYGDIVINSPTAVEATTFYKSLLEYAPKNALNFTWDDALALNQQGKVAVSIMWTDQTYAIEDSSQSRVAGKMGYKMLPIHSEEIGHTHQIGGQSMYIPKTSQHPEATYLFMEWLMLPRNQIKQQKLGGASPRMSTYEEESIKELPWTEASIDALKHTHPAMLYTFPESLQIGEVLKEQLSKILSGQVSVKKGLDDAAVELDQLLGDKAKLRYEVGK